VSTSGIEELNRLFDIFYGMLKNLGGFIRGIVDSVIRTNLEHLSLVYLRKTIAAAARLVLD
jgi:hypothetical protein